jgi:hypothetical protein
MECRGPASNKGRRRGQKKLCFLASDRTPLADVLSQSAKRPDCDYIEYSAWLRDGMFLGRSAFSHIANSASHGTSESGRAAIFRVEAAGLPRPVRPESQ